MAAIDDNQIHEIVQRVVAQVTGQAQSAAPAAPAPAPAAPQPAPQVEATPRGAKVVAIGADHGGFDLKENLRAYIAELGFDVRDMGTYNKNAVDYPEFAHGVAKLVSTGKAWRGIMIDGSPLHALALPLAITVTWCVTSFAAALALFRWR